MTWKITVYPARGAGGLSYPLVPGTCLSFGRADGAGKVMQALSSDSNPLWKSFGEVQDRITTAGIEHVTLEPAALNGESVTSGVAAVVMPSETGWQVVNPSRGSTFTHREWGKAPTHIAAAGTASDRTLHIEGVSRQSVWIPANEGLWHRLDFEWEGVIPAAPVFGFGLNTRIRVDFHLTDLDQKLLCFFFSEHLRFPLERDPQPGGMSERRKRAMIRGGWTPQTRAHGDLMKRIAGSDNPWQLPLNAELNGQLRTLDLLIAYNMLRPEMVKDNLTWIKGQISERDLEAKMAAARYADDVTARAVLAGWNMNQVTALKDFLEKTIEHVLKHSVYKISGVAQIDPVTQLPDLTGTTVTQVHHLATHGVNQLINAQRLEGQHLEAIGGVTLGWLGGTDSSARADA